MATLKTNRIKAFYKCKQEELYQVLLHGWDSFIQNQPIFEAISTIHTLLFGNTQQQAVLNTKAMLRKPKATLPLFFLPLYNSQTSSIFINGIAL